MIIFVYFILFEWFYYFFALFYFNSFPFLWSVFCLLTFFLHHNNKCFSPQMWSWVSIENECMLIIIFLCTIKTTYILPFLPKNLYYVSLCAVKWISFWLAAKPQSPNLCSCCRRITHQLMHMVPPAPWLNFQIII